MKPSSAKRVLPYADFIGNTKKYQLTDLSDNDLTAALRESSATAQRIAIIKEWIRRITGLSLFDTQLSAAYSLINKRIAELPTGEGKTLAAVVAAVCYALEGYHVHILVFNDYLAKRDWAENREIYEVCGLTVGFADQHSTIEARKAAYACDVTYVSAKQAGFDYLRDFTAQTLDEVLFPAFDVAIIDEADSIMIDECTTPLVLAGEVTGKKDIVKGIDACIRALATDEYDISQTENLVWLTEKGTDRIEAHFGVNLYGEENISVLNGVQNALEAHHLLTRDKDYILKDGAVQLVEATTGRVIINKRYPELLHRAVEAKEGLELSPLTVIYNSIPMQYFLRLYPALCGMTGTAATSAKELDSTYDLKVDIIPPHTPGIRIDHADAFFTAQETFLQSVIAQVAGCYSRKQPVLIGTRSVAESEQFSELLSCANVPHSVLNAKNDEEEAALVAQAGKPGHVTISTNMAGRGVDIRLGGADEQLRDETVAAGGLFIIGVGINRSERIDNQLRGRAGRQGDPGESKFFIWLEDADLSCRMTPLAKVRAEIGNVKKRVNAVRKVQRKMESESAQARYSLSRFSSVVEEQRVRISELRMEMLKGERYFAFLENANPEKYRQVLQKAGMNGIKCAEQQLALHFINTHWAKCLDTFEDVRRGIHFISLRYESPLDEYVRIVFKLCDQMSDDIKQDIIKQMEILSITADGINMEEYGLRGGTTTWTYAVDENMGQFNSLSRKIKQAIEKFSGENGILTKYYRRKRDRMRS